MQHDLIIQSVLKRLWQNKKIVKKRKKHHPKQHRQHLLEKAKVQMKHRRQNHRSSISSKSHIRQNRIIIEINNKPILENKLIIFHGKVRKNSLA